MNILEISQPDQEDQSCWLRDGAYVIGRSEEADIRLAGGAISACHARLVVSGERMQIEDLGSCNGIEVDDLPVVGTAKVAPGQRIAIGDVSIRVVEASEEGSEVGYDRRALIAAGGMGEVYEAWQGGMGREVAMKVIRGDPDEEGLRRFLTEARVTGQLEHPNIVPVHEIGQNDDGEPYYTMKYVRGLTLADIIQQLKSSNVKASLEYPLSSLLTIFQKVCDAISFAHSRGVVHRDLKPGNIMVGDHGEVLVMDWGVAKVVGGVESASSEGEFADGRTLAGSLVGTPRYMAPEQARGEVEELDARADVFALGRILFELLYLEPAVSGASPFEILEKVRTGTRDRIMAPSSAHLPHRRPPEALTAVCRKAMAHDREQRYASVEDLQREVAAYQGGFATSAQNASLGTQLGLFAKRHRAVVGSIAASLLLLVAMGGYFVLQLVSERNKAVSAQSREHDARVELERTGGTLEQVRQKERTLRESVASLSTEKTQLGQEVANKKQQVGALEDSVAGLDLRRKELETQVANAAGKAGQITEGIAQIEGGVLDFGQDFEATLLELSRSQARNGLLERALRSAKRAVTLSPNSPRARVNYGNRLLLSGNFTQAQREYQAALEKSQGRQASSINRSLTAQALTVAQRCGSQFEEQKNLDRSRLGEVRNLLVKLKQIEDNAIAIAKLARDYGQSPEDAAAFRRDEVKLRIRERVLQRLTGMRSLTGWREDRVQVDDTAKVRVNLSGLPVERVPKLDGLTIDSLNLSGCQLVNINGLRGADVASLSLLNNPGLRDFSTIDSLSRLRQLELPPHAWGIDGSRLRRLEKVRHSRFFRTNDGWGSGSRFLKLSRLTDEAWRRWGSTLVRLGLEDMRRDRLTVLVDQARYGERGFELDLRGTGIVDLVDIQNLEVRTLHIDTKSPRELDLAPLRKIRTLRALNLTGANVSRIKPALPLQRLTQLGLSRGVVDAYFLQGQGTLLRTGFGFDARTRLADRSVADFFKQREDVEEIPAEGLLYEQSFDDYKTIGDWDWQVVSDTDQTRDAVWTTDIDFGLRRGGGYCRFLKAGDDSDTWFFKAGSGMVSAMKNAGGGLLEYDIRLASSGEPRMCRQIELRGESRSLVLASYPQAGPDWKRVRIPLDRRAPWLLDGPFGERATNTQIAEVLDSLESIRIQAEMSSKPGEPSGLDEIRIWNRAGGSARLAQLAQDGARASATLTKASQP